MLDIVASYHCMQFQGKCKIQTKENGEKLYFGPDLGQLGTNSGRHFFFFLNLTSTVSYNHVKYRKKLMIESSENLVTDPRTDGRTDRRLPDGQTDGRE